MHYSLLLCLSGVAAYPWVQPDTSYLHKRQIEAPPPAANIYTYEPLDTEHWDPETWELCTNELVQDAYQSTPYVANGYIGQRFAAEGHGFSRDKNRTDPDSETQPINGWPLDNARTTFGTVSGFWNSQPDTPRTNFKDIADTGGESVISGLPHWATLYFRTADGEVYGPGVVNSTVKQFKQCMSLKHGIVRTDLLWQPTDSNTSYVLNYTVVANRMHPSVGYMRLDVTPEASGNGSFADILDGRGALRTTFNEKGHDNEDDIIWSSVHPAGLEDITAWVFSHVRLADTGTKGNGTGFPVSRNESTVAQSFHDIQMTAGETYTIEKFVGIASTDAFPENAEEQARSQMLQAANAGQQNLTAAHAEAWDEIWAQGSITAAYDDQLQIGIQATLFHLLSSLRADSEGTGFNDNSIAVGGLSSEAYAGFIFWDADLWMFPGLAALWPEYAKPIINYRYRLLNQSIENGLERNFTDSAAYSWTSGRFGNCTGTGPCFDYQYHLNSDIALAVYDYYINSGDKQFLEEEGWPIVSAVTNFLSQFVTYENGSYHTRNVTDPDEYANHVDDGAFTNISIMKLMGWAKYLAKELGISHPEKWDDVEEKMYIPYDSKAGIIPEFRGMNGSVEIKQVDVLLAQYPVGFQFNDTQAKNDAFYYSKAQSPDGPAMSFSIYSIVSSSLLETGCVGHTYSLMASQSYLRAPWYQFSEQVNDNITENGNTNPAFPFLTGHGGYLQVWTHGYTGFRTREDGFYIDPSLPPHLVGGVKYSSFKYKGAAIEIDIRQNGTTVTRIEARNSTLDTQDTVPIIVSDKNSKGGTYKLAVGQSIEIGTRLPHKETPIPANNIAMCAPVTSNTTWAPGGFPLAAVDGSNGTAWQPRTLEPSSITIDLANTFPPTNGTQDLPTGMRTIDSVLIVWGRAPAQRWSLHMGNNTDWDPETNVNNETVGSWESVWSDDSVAISQEWDPERYVEPILEDGNYTSVKFDRAYTGRFARLTIEGSQGEIVNGHGAFVYEVALMGDMRDFD